MLTFWCLIQKRKTSWLDQLNLSFIKNLLALVSISLKEEPEKSMKYMILFNIGFLGYVITNIRAHISKMMVYTNLNGNIL